MRGVRYGARGGKEGGTDRNAPRSHSGRSEAATPSHPDRRSGTLLSVRNLRTVFDTPRGVVPAVDDVSFDLERGKSMGIVGESGSGKTQLALSIIGLLSDGARIDDGEIWFDGKDVLTLAERERRRIRGGEIAMIFQEPMTSLDPLYTVGDQIAEGVRLHQRLRRAQAVERAVELLDMVGIARPRQLVAQYPASLSGGMRQRVMIAMALACNPQLLIADEPTTALDVTIQAQIIELIRTLQENLGVAVLFISHDLGVIAEVAHDVSVMYAGQLVERTTVEVLFDAPAHPYSRSLLEARPTLRQGRTALRPIPGEAPNPFVKPSGCPFHPRCPHAMEVCGERRPRRFRLEAAHEVYCWLHDTSEQRERRTSAPEGSS